MSRRRKLPNLYRFPAPAVDVDAVAAVDDLADADGMALPARRSPSGSLTSIEDIEAFVEELCVNDRKGEEHGGAERDDVADLSDLAALSDAINVAIDGLSFLQHELEVRTRPARARRQTRTH